MFGVTCRNSGLRIERAVARPHILFVQAQALPWSASGFANLGVQVDVKVLSRDDVGGAVTELMKLPRGLKIAGPVYFDCNLSFGR